MDQQGDNSRCVEPQFGHFEATDWKTVIEACQGNNEGSFVALDKLCGTYRYPLYVYVRKKGFNSHDAEDFVQGFFAHLLSTEGLKTVNQGKGKFRSFLIASLENYISKERERSHAQKRGGGTKTLSLDAMEAEERYANEPRDDWTPVRALNRTWALVMIETVLDRLRAEQKSEIKRARFDELRSSLATFGDGENYEQMAATLGMTEGNLRVELSRLRARFRYLFRGEVGRTVSDPSEIEAEINELLRALTHWDLPAEKG